MVILMIFWVVNISMLHNWRLICPARYDAFANLFYFIKLLIKLTYDFYTWNLINQEGTIKKIPPKKTNNFVKKTQWICRMVEFIGSFYWCRKAVWNWPLFFNFWTSYWYFPSNLSLSLNFLSANKLQLPDQIECQVWNSLSWRIYRNTCIKNKVHCHHWLCVLISEDFMTL